MRDRKQNCAVSYRSLAISASFRTSLVLMFISLIRGDLSRKATVAVVQSVGLLSQVSVWLSVSIGSARTLTLAIMQDLIGSEQVRCMLYQTERQFNFSWTTNCPLPFKSIHHRPITLVDIYNACQPLSIPV